MAVVRLVRPKGPLLDASDCGRGMLTFMAPNDDRLDLASLVASSSWADRVDAVQLLRGRRDQAALALWRQLLHDPLDTAPVQAAAEALVEQGDEIALDLVFAAIADEPVDDEH